MFLGWPNCHNLLMNAEPVQGKAICERWILKQNMHRTLKPVQNLLHKPTHKALCRPAATSDKRSTGAVKLMRTPIRLLPQPKSIRSIIDATRWEQRHGLAWYGWFLQFYNFLGCYERNTYRLGGGHPPRSLPPHGLETTLRLNLSNHIYLWWVGRWV